ncbi:hypothetical protein [Sediminibacillus albus]|uniref:Methyl-accepting chemotaxis protein n=1 Tax=Sediminibacillus albus TaxID=407036 RepID=A0A1G9BAB4_9BACI|nr:hypothetical protein [Sediminibacillus albus]SDK35990.1 hypothetical protein SAMN05216243_2884 [Sediminibacillus albus]
MFNKSVKAKLFTSLLLVSIIPLILISSLLYFSTNQGLENIVQKNLLSSKETISTQLNNTSEELLELTQSYAKNPDVIEAFRNGDRQALTSVVQPIFERLQTVY